MPANGDRPYERGAGPASNWQAGLQTYLAALSQDETDALHARAIHALDRATRARTLETAEIARLSALAGYLAPRVERQAGTQPAPTELALMMGLLAGYQLAAGEAMPQEPDPFAD